MDSSLSVTPILGSRYQLQQTLGTGGMSSVYRARDLLLKRPVAIKILRPDLSRDAAFRDRFRLEASAAANLSHPNLVTVHDFGVDGERLYIVMEYVPGTDLKTIIKQRKRFSVEEALQLFIQACAGIGYAHRAGLVHCDVKPHNMLVTPDQRLKVADFGIARALSTIHPEEQHDIVWGSPQYFSPEQAVGTAPSPASDVYSLGVILYEMLTGQLPFTSNDPEELVRLHRDAYPIPPHRLNKEIPPALDQIIVKVLSKEPSARYRTADQLGRILTSFNNPETNHPHNSSIGNPVPPPPETIFLPPNIQQPPYYMTPETEDEQGINIDWINVGLGFVAFLAIGGLIPFLLYVWFTINSNHP
jgi:serine/threonine-protein kinase